MSMEQAVEIAKLRKEVFELRTKLVTAREARWVYATCDNVTRETARQALAALEDK